MDNPATTALPTPPASSTGGFSPATCDLIRGQLGLAKNPRQSEFLQALLIKGDCP
jgi:hypothetical protein